jgi:hypothetical protein
MKGTAVIGILIALFVGFILITAFTPTIKSQITTAKLTETNSAINATYDASALLVGYLPALYVLIVVGGVLISLASGLGKKH